MSTWDINPKTGGASIDDNGVANIPSNTVGDDFIVYTITYVDDEGCSSSVDYEVPPCEIHCDCSNIEGRIVYTNTYLPTPRVMERNVMLFSANTQGCGSISAYCSSSASSIFYSDGENLVRVEELEANKKYAVYADVLPLRSSPERSCVVNIYITLRDGTVCQTIAKPYIQSPTINCEKLQDTSWSSGGYYLSGYLIDHNGGSRESIARTYSNKSGDALSDKGFYLLSGYCPSWLGRGDINNFRYVYNDGRWYVHCLIDPNSSTDDREAQFTQVGYIIDSDKSVVPGVEYTASMLKRMSGTFCGEFSKKVTIKQEGCNCTNAWTSSTTSHSASYSADRILIDVTSEYLNDCARLTGVVKKDECDWLVSGIADDKLNIVLSENESSDSRRCTLILYITDSSGINPCEKEFEIVQGGTPLDCTNCESVKTKGCYVPSSTSSSRQIPASGGTSSSYNFEYNTSLVTSPCNGNITYSFSTDGIEHPCSNPRLDHVSDNWGHKEVFFTADPNTESVEKSFKVTVRYSNASLSNCTNEFTVYQMPAPDAPLIVLTQIDKGSTTPSGNLVTDLSIRAGSYYYNVNKVDIAFNSPKNIQYPMGMKNREIYEITATTNMNEDYEATAVPTVLDDSTTQVTITLTKLIPKSCNSSSYSFELLHTEGGVTVDNPIPFTNGERKKIAELKNSIPESALTCCAIEVKTTQTSVFDNTKFEVISKPSGGYEIYATAMTGITVEQIATADVTWYYLDSSGNKHYEDTGIVYLKNG